MCLFVFSSTVFVGLPVTEAEMDPSNALCTPSIEAGLLPSYPCRYRSRRLVTYVAYHRLHFYLATSAHNPRITCTPVVVFLAIVRRYLPPRYDDICTFRKKTCTLFPGRDQGGRFSSLSTFGCGTRLKRSALLPADNM